MSNSRRYSSRKKTEQNEYVHEYQLLGVTDQTYKTVTVLRNFITRTEWIPSSIIYNFDADTDSRTKKSLAELRISLDTLCQDRKKQLMVENLYPFLDAVKQQPSEVLAAWISRHSRLFKPGANKLDAWRAKALGFDGIVDLLSQQNPGLQKQLELQPGEWIGFQQLVQEVILGKIKYDAPRNVNNGNGGGQMDVDNGSDGHAQIASGAQIASDADPSGDANGGGNDEANGDPSVDDEHEEKSGAKTLQNMHVVALIERRVDEEGKQEPKSCFDARLRSTRQHPYFKLKAADQFGVFDVDKVKAAELPVFGVEGVGYYVYDEEDTRWFAFDKEVLRVVLIRQHALKKVHARIVSQRDMTTWLRGHALQSKSAQKLRLVAGDEFKLACVVGTYLQLLAYIGDESVVFTKNQDMIRSDPNKSDYAVLQEWNVPYENATASNYNRVPRSTSQLKHLVEQKTSTKTKTSWFVRLNPLRIREKILVESAGRDEPGEEGMRLWDQHVAKLRKFGVLDWIRDYMSRFFPGQERKCVRAGLFQQVEAEKPKYYVNNLDWI